MPYRLRNIALAVGLAALAALLTSFYVSSYKRSVQEEQENVSVFVAAAEIPAGTTGADAVERGLLREAEVPRRSIVPGAISSPDQVRELVAVETVYEGEQVSVRRFHSAQEAGIRAELTGNMRAFQLAGDRHQLLAGTLERGDRVDILGHFALEGDAADTTASATRVILRDILVLSAVGPGLAESKVSNTSGEGSVQLAVTDAQAQKLFFAKNSGSWTLVLRPVSEATNSPEHLETLQNVLCDGLRRPTTACPGR